MSNKALVVLSGGQDSTTCLAWAKKYFREVHAVTFDYNQRHRRELSAALAVARIFGVASHEMIELGPIMKGASPLTNPNAQLELYKDHDSMEKTIGDRIELTFVPMRNPLFLTIAANRAVVLGCSHIITGVCQADNANYPDCRQTFISSMQWMVQEALGMPGGAFNIHAPLMDLSKDQSIQLMMNLGGFGALAFTHTSYDGAYPPVGKDHATILRAHGFEKAMQPDPLVVRAAVIDQVMDLPKTPNYSDLDRIEEVEADIRNLMALLDGEGQ